ncbi:MAG: nucleotide pyrophosphohydrolase [Dehalococcoidia bacterium]|jgi:NTP pyrophosphatase (non-canonical NTP hydrolase)
MLNRSIAHKCGHIEAHSFESGQFGRVSKEEIERRINDLAQQPCRNCREKGLSDVLPGDNLMSDEKTTLIDLRDMVKKFVNDREWNQYHNPKDVAIAISLESSELLEHFLWVPDRESGAIAKETEKLVKLEEELADIIIYCLSFANVLKIDVAKAVEDKVRLNAIRYPVTLEKSDDTKPSDFDSDL